MRPEYGWNVLPVLLAAKLLLHGFSSPFFTCEISGQLTLAFLSKNCDYESHMSPHRQLRQFR